MGYSANNYSVFNNYIYVERSRLLSTLDTLSSPCRWVVGGRDVYLHCNLQNEPMSTRKKVFILALSLLIFPVAVVAVASFAFKVVLCPFLWEAKKVEAESKKTENFIYEFKRACKTDEYAKARDTLLQRPEILENIDTTSSFRNVFEANMLSWDHLKTIFPLIHEEQAIRLISWITQLKLEVEFEKKRHLTSGEEFIQLISASLKQRESRLETYAGVETAVEKCYNKLLSEGLGFKSSDETVVDVLVKMDIADSIVNELSRIKLARAKDSYARLLVESDEMVRRQEISKEYGTIGYHLHDKETMKRIHAGLQCIRGINRGWEVEKRMIDVLRSDLNEGAKWLGIYYAYTDFDKILRSVNIGDTSRNLWKTTKQSVGEILKLMEAKVPETEEEVYALEAQMMKVVDAADVSNKAVIARLEVLLARRSVDNIGFEGLLEILRAHEEGALTLLSLHFTQHLREVISQRILELLEKTTQQTTQNDLKQDKKAS